MAMWIDPHELAAKRRQAVGRADELRGSQGSIQGDINRTKILADSIEALQNDLQAIAAPPAEKVRAAVLQRF